MKKMSFYLTSLCLTLLFGAAGTVPSMAEASWVGNSAVYVNGTWYYAGTNFDWCAGGAFQSADLGTLTSLLLAGQSQAYDNGTEWADVDRHHALFVNWFIS